MKKFNDEGKMKMIIGVVIAAILIIAMIGVVLISAGIVDGAPQLSIDVYIREADGEGALKGTVDTVIPLTETIFGAALVPMTTYQADIIGVEPATIYELEFVITFQGDLPDDAPTDQEMFTDVTLFGIQGLRTDPLAHVFYSLGSSPNVILDIPTPPPEYIATADYIKTDNKHYDTVWNLGEGHTPIRGSYIDGSLWEVDMTTTSGFAGTDAYWGNTIATIELIVDQNGNVGITVTDVGFTAWEV